MLYFLQQLLNGVHSGALYALLAFGYVVTNGVVKRTNLAYGPIFAFCGHAMIMAAIFGYDALWLTWPAAIALGLAVAACYAALSSTILSRTILLPLAGRAPNVVVAATLGAGLVLAELSRIAAGTRDYWLPPLLSHPVVFASGSGFNVTLTLNQIAGCLIAALAIGAGAIAMNGSAFGRRWRALSDDPLAAAMCGVDAPRTFHQAVFAGALMAALAGALAAIYYGNISFGMGMLYGLKILFVTAAGSYALPAQAAAGAFAYGIGESLWTGYFASEWRDAWMLAFLVAMLVLRAPARD